ncbi:hypothetical protein OH76DRAFT_1487965 [Lentinus brumalis]|uniref:F-box domain-containing protein n=1 Tax=Lentinus brumalis TaxID=2498619 RepID=A0A371CSL1_9APHY|nr:hypothetical protein OH76DRAFT_1487965 [Polyporus brumalis]
MSLKTIERILASLLWKQNLAIYSPPDSTRELVVAPRKTVLLTSLAEDKGPCAIHRIPPELLIVIFKDVLSDYFRGPTFRISSRDDARVDPSSLISITQVCRWWRDVAISWPLLWSRLDNNAHIAQSATFFLRSQDSPLSVYFTTTGRPLKDIDFNIGCRLRRLDITVLPEASDIFPFIRSLAVPDSLQCCTVNYSRFIQIPPDADVERVSLFGASVLPLKALAMHNVANWIPANSFPHLTHLYLDFGVGRGDATQLVRLVDLLRNAPKVEYLLVSNISWMHPQSSPRPPLVPLRHLCFFLLAHTSIEVAYTLLSAIAMPRHAYVRLDGMYADPRRPNLPSLPVLPVVEETNRLEIVTEASELRLVAEGPSSGLWMQMDFDLRETGDRHRLDTWLLSLHTALPVRNVATLLLSLGDHANLVPSLLPRFTGVTEICLVTHIQYERKTGPTDASWSVARALYSALAIPNVCPRLRSLCVDIAVGVNPLIPNIYASFLADMMISRSENGLSVPLVGIQAFAGSRWSGVRPFDEVEDQMTPVEHFNEVQLLPPGPYLEPFLERLCWVFDEFEKYWEVEDVYKPMYAD